MKILVIGSKGFIGSHAVQFFDGHHDVWGCDVFTNYNEKNFILMDTLNPSYHILFQNHQFDVCINCAGAASVPDSLKHPERDYELNVRLVFTLLNLIRLYNPSCKFINISSAAVYGNPSTLPVKEDQPLMPVSPYGLHKMYAEQICHEFASCYSIQTTSIRVFSAYGPGLKKQIFWDLFMKSQNSNNVELFGTGEETRDYIFISDIIKAIDHVKDHAPFKAECFNVGLGEQHSLNEIATYFFECLQWKGKLTFSGLKRNGDPDYWQADISKLTDSSFRPSVSIKEGIKKYAEWVKSISLD